MTVAAAMAAAAACWGALVAARRSEKREKAVIQAINSVIAQQIFANMTSPDARNY